MKYTKQRGDTPSAFEDLVDETSGDFSADIKPGFVAQVFYGLSKH